MGSEATATAGTAVSEILSDDCEAVFDAALAAIATPVGALDLSDLRRALRRLRANLRTFRPLLDASWVESAREMVLVHELRAESIEALGDMLTLLRHHRDRAARDFVLAKREHLTTALVAEIESELRNGSLLHCICRNRLPMVERSFVQEAAVEVLPGCVRRLWRHVITNAEPADALQAIELAIWAEKASFAAAASIATLGVPAARLADVCHNLAELLQPLRRVDAIARSARALLPEPIAAQIEEILEEQIDEGWLLAQRLLPGAIRDVRAAEVATLTPDDGLTIVGAGGVVWRVGAVGEVEVLLVHRTRRNGWSLPKGKAWPGETAEQCAVREVREETGLECSIGDELPSLQYRDRNGRQKFVRYWSMRVEAGEPRPDAEVDETAWFALRDVRSVLAKAREARVAEALDALAVCR
jgi:8-oxo-dGTP diphosphatase